MRTLTQAKLFLQASLKDGLHCECCGQWAQMYKRSIYDKMVIALANLHRLSLVKKQAEFFYFKDFTANLGGFDFGKLAHWDLIEHMEKDPDDTTKKTSGFWKITPKGISFLRGEISVPKYAWIYNNMLIEFSPEMMNVHEAVKGYFDYEELMQAV